MALQVGTVDGLINIGPKITDVFVKAIAAFAEQGVEYAKSKGVPFGAAFQRFTYPVYSGESSEFKVTSIDKPVYTKSGKEQSPAFITYCRKMGLLAINESQSLFKLTTLGELLLNNEITIQEYAFVIISKQGIFQNGVYKAPLLAPIVELLEKESSITVEETQNYISKSYNDNEIWKTRLDILLGALATSGLLVKDNNTYYIGGLPQARILDDIKNNINKLSPALLDDNEDYTMYMGESMWGVFDILLPNNVKIYEKLFPNLVQHSQLCGTYLKAVLSSNKTNQIIFYGAPGTGKSHGIKEATEEAEKQGNVFRTTFHPDSDYSTFIGAYKPTMAKRAVRNVAGDIVKNNGQEVFEETIVYKFTPQAFTNAYIRAWQTNEPVYLVIEEINRGNCAQIFGDLFQLLDRDDEGKSKYPIIPDTDLGNYIESQLLGYDNVPEEIRQGKSMLLPSNLFIWASMNTSDQSLFPIDSAFKRRWDWKYVPIENAHKNYVIQVNNTEYDWWEFLKAINKEVFELTNSEDKQLGYFFVKKTDGIIDVETLVNKVYFYLWNDVFKDYDLDSQKAFRNQETQRAISFKEFFEGGLNEELAEQVLLNLELEGRPLDE